MEEKKNLVLQVKEFFEFENLSEFKKEWSTLSNEEKEWFKTEVDKFLRSLD